MVTFNSSVKEDDKCQTGNVSLIYKFFVAFNAEQIKMKYDVNKCVRTQVKIRAGHFRYFLNFFNSKNDFCIFYQVKCLFLHQSYLKGPLPVKLTR